jgi:hypothetical protein
LGVDLPVEALDRRLLGRDLIARQVGGEAIVAVVDAGDHVAGANLRILLDQKPRDIARDLRAQCRGVGADIGVVGGNQEAARRRIVETEPGGGKHRSCRRNHQDALAVCFERTDCGRFGGGALLRWGASVFDLVGGSGCRRCLYRFRFPRLDDREAGGIGELHALQHGLLH